MTSDVRAALDAGDDGFHEIQLNGKQLVFLGMATTLVSVVIFLCGVLVGRGVKPLDTVAQAAGPQAFDAPVTTSSVAPGTIATPAPASPTPSSGDSGVVAAAAAAAASDASAGDTEPTPLGDAAEAPPTDLAAATPAAPVRPAAVEPKPVPKVDPRAAAKTTPPVQATVVPPAAPKPAPVAAAPKPTPAPTPTAVATTAPATAGGKIAVQVGAFKTRPEADALARRLSGRGYAAYVMSPTNDGKKVYRVRVGNYASADEAQRISTRLTQQEKLKPWITR